VSALSKRLATTLAVLDEIAQDLRDELAKIEGEEQLIESASLRSDVEDGAESSREGARQPKPEKMLSDTELQNIFEEVMGRSLNASPTERRRVRRGLAQNGIGDRDSYTSALGMVRGSAELVFMDEPALLPDIDYLLAAEKAPNETAVEQSLRRRSKNFVDKIEQSRAFYDTYMSGEIFVGTAVRVKPRYALVQLSSGDTATLSVRHIEGTSSNHLNMEDFVSPGDSLQVEVVNSDFAQGRIEVRPVGELQAKG
jgi:hypothetical protein